MLHPFENINSQPEFYSFFTDRFGGYSKGNYASFNCNLYAGDNESNVLRNRELLENEIQAKLIVPHQTHGCQVLRIDENFLKLNANEQQEKQEGIDALVTNQKGVAICISTADCIPILLCDSNKQVVAAIHAGWRGTQKRIVRHTIEVMKFHYNCRPQDIFAGIGPGISVQAFEVGNEVVEQFDKVNFPMNEISFLNSETNKYHIDLKRCNTLQLLECGLNFRNIEDVQICTFNNSENYFSARKLGIKSGRILSGILIK